MLTDLVQIRRLGEKKLDENKRLRVYLKRHNFVERRLKKIAEDIEELILKRTETGCVLLSGNECTVYEARPHTCECFPHLVHGPGSFLSRMWEMPDRATYRSEEHTS